MIDMIELLNYGQDGVQLHINRLNSRLWQKRSEYPTKDRKKIQELKKLQLSYARAIPQMKTKKLSSTAIEDNKQ